MIRTIHLFSGKQKLEGNKTSIHRTESGYPTTDKGKDSSDCGDGEYDGVEEMDKKKAGKKEGKLKEHPKKFVSNDSENESLPEKQQLSGLDNQENSKSKSDPSKTNGTEWKKDLFANLSKETGNETSGVSETTEKGFFILC